MRIIPIFALAAIFAACDSNNNLETSKEVITTDTSSMYNSDVFTDTAISEPAAAAPVRTITQTKTVYVDRTPKNTRTNQNNTVNSTPSTSTTGTGSQTGTTGTTSPAPTTEKKDGMSSSTKGAIIGGAAGAIGGAIISKKKGKGAIIGGVAGAAGGYILGRKKDRKDTTQ